MAHRHGALPFQEGLRIMLERDIPRLGLERGEAGIIGRASPAPLGLEADFGGRTVRLRPGDLLDVAPSWALPVRACHNALYPAVVVALAPKPPGGGPRREPFDRRDLFLSLSRGHSLAVLIGPRASLAAALAAFGPKPDLRSRLDSLGPPLP
jgi:hypothetical protein